MTRDMCWSVRVSCGGELASGFLVAPDQVLTCRHVVDAHPDEAWTVTFPGTGAERQARVTSLAEDADIAVLTLDTPVPDGIAPVPLAPFHTIDTGRDLCAYGFPHRVGGWTQVMLTALPGSPGDAQRQVQVRADPVLVTGYSGGPVYDVRTMQVVGMVTDANPQHRSGRIVPVSELCRVVEGLTERIALGEAFEAPAYAGLVTLLDRADAGPGRLPSLLEGLTVCRPERTLPSALAQVEYLATEDPRPAEMVRAAVVAALKRVKDARPDLAAGIEEWVARYYFGNGDRPAGPSVEEAPPVHEPAGEPPWVLVVIDLSASPRGGYLVHGWCVFGPTDCRPIGTREREPEVTEAALEEHVVDLVLDGLSRIPAVRGERRPVVEFVLKRRLILDATVDRWGEDTDAGAALGWDYAVVVRDLNSFRRPSIPLREQWLHLRPPAGAGAATGDPLLDWLGCVASADRAHVNSRVRGDDIPRGLALHSRPGLDVLNVAIGGGIPVMVWTRLRCPADTHDGEPCTGRSFQQALDTELAQVDGSVVGELREAVRNLRRKAGNGTAEGDPVHGREIVIMWDDPERRPPAVLDRLG